MSPGRARVRFPPLVRRRKDRLDSNFGDTLNAVGPRLDSATAERAFQFGPWMLAEE